MPLIRHSERPEADPYPGVKRQSIVGRDTGAGSLHTSWVTIAPGARAYVHRHKVEEAMLIVAGEGLAILGDETMPVQANETLLAPAGVRHGFVNTGSEPLIVSGIFPTVDVEVFVEESQAD
jgi:mannose-6-phosphate isomerase-like protein (cupin superfamily)